MGQEGEQLETVSKNGHIGFEDFNFSVLKVVEPSLELFESKVDYCNQNGIKCPFKDLTNCG